MSQWHLRDLENALTRRGWRIVGVRPGDGYHISATWEARRSSRRPSLLIDFEGMDGSGDFCHPLEHAFGCAVRARTGISLYFGKSRPQWQEDLAAFVSALDNEGGA